LADVIPIGLRALAFMAVLQAAGVPMFVSLGGNDLARAARPIRALGIWTAAVGLVLTGAHQLVEPARLAGDLSGVLDVSLQRMLLASDAGTAASVRMLGLGLLLGGQLGAGRPAALIGAALVAASFAFMGHTAADDQRWWLAPVLVAHLAIVAFWFGALWPLLLTARYETLDATARIVAKLSRLAVRLVPMIFVAGVLLAIGLVPDVASLGTPYGALLLTKIGAFALLMAVAARNKWRLGPRLGRADETALRALRRSVQTEWVLIAGVVAVTATMTAVFSPMH
jgi:putative copper export protein